MKKSMVAFLVAGFIATSGMAGVVQWSTSAVTAAPTGALTAGNAYAALLVLTVGTDVSSVFTAIAAGNYNGGGLVGASGAGWKIIDGKTATAASGGIGALASNQKQDAFLTANIAQSAYAIVFNNASYQSATYFVYSTMKSVTSGPDDLSTPPGAVSWGPGVWASNGGWLAVAPEPTSLSLLALGAAVLGLRRKNHK